MNWDVEFTNEFKSWWDEISEAQQDSVAATVELLMERGPHLPFPYSSNIKSSRHGVLRELRIQSGGIPLRVFYAFDPRRIAILLVGNSKAGDDRFYESYVPIADDIFDHHLQELKEEGLIQ